LHRRHLCSGAFGSVRPIGSCRLLLDDLFQISRKIRVQLGCNLPDFEGIVVDCCRSLFDVRLDPPSLFSCRWSDRCLTSVCTSRGRLFCTAVIPVIRFVIIGADIVLVALFLDLLDVLPDFAPLPTKRLDFETDNAEVCKGSPSCFLLGRFFALLVPDTFLLPVTS